MAARPDTISNIPRATPIKAGDLVERINVAPFPDSATPRNAGNDAHDGG
jgi:hypothetical protein